MDPCEHRPSAVALAVIAMLALASTAPAEPTAGELLDRARVLSATTRKWDDRLQRMALTIVDRRGGERHRELLIRLKKYPADRTRTILFFLSPPDVKGVGFLQWADPHGKDEQWLYLPELKRVRQISGGAKRESFVGTDFSYEDLAIISQALDWNERDAPARGLRLESLDGRDCHVIERTPAAKELAYSRLRLWLTVDDLTVLQFEMDDASSRLVKRLRLSDIRAVGAIPTAFRMEMRNVRTGSHTLVEFTEVQYDTGMSDDRFTQRALEHGP